MIRRSKSPSLSPHPKRATSQPARVIRTIMKDPSGVGAVPPLPALRGATGGACSAGGGGSVGRPHSSGSPLAVSPAKSGGHVAAGTARGTAYRGEEGMESTVAVGSSVSGGHVAAGSVPTVTNTDSASQVPQVEVSSSGAGGHVVAGPVLTATNGAQDTKMISGDVANEIRGILSKGNEDGRGTKRTPSPKIIGDAQGSRPRGGGRSAAGSRSPSVPAIAARGRGGAPAPPVDPVQSGDVTSSNAPPKSATPSPKRAKSVTPGSQSRAASTPAGTRDLAGASGHGGDQDQEPRPNPIDNASLVGVVQGVGGRHVLVSGLMPGCSRLT